MSQSEQSRWFFDEVHPHEAALRGYLRSHFPSVDTDDVVQESYLKIVRARPAVRITFTKAYLFSIARNTAITIFNRRKIYSETPVNELPSWRVSDDGRGAVEAVDAHERHEIMSEAILQLPNRCGDVLHLAVLCGLSNAEVARELGLSEHTVRVHLARGIKKCADFLRKKGELP